MGDVIHHLNSQFFEVSDFRMGPISDDQLPTLQRLLQQHPSSDPYQRSAAYLAMTGRDGLWWARHGDSAVIFCRHPNARNEILVFPPIGSEGQALLAKVIDSVSRTGENVRLARFDAERTSAPRDSIEVDEALLDWRYPVHILDTQKVSELKGGDLQVARTRMNGLRTIGITVRDIDPARDAAAIETVLGRWAHEDSYAEPYRRLFALYRNTSLAGRLISVDGEPSGLSIWEETDRERGMANALAHLAVHEVKGLSHFVMVDMCRTLAERGFSKVCIGGSETEGLDRFKRKFAPVSSVRLNSYVVPEVEAVQVNRARPLQELRAAEPS